MQKAAWYFFKTFTLGGVSTIIMKMVQRNSVLGFRALDEWRMRNAKVPVPIALPKSAQLLSLY